MVMVLKIPKVRGGAGGDGHGGSGRWEGRQKGCGIVKSNLEVKESRPCQHASWLRFNREEAANTSIVLSFCYRMIWVMDSIPWVRCASGNVSSLCQDSNLSSQVDPDPCVKVSEFTAIATLLAPSTVLILDIFLFALFLLLNFGSVCKSRGGGSG